MVQTIYYNILYVYVYGIILPIDFHIFQDGLNRQPYIYIYIIYIYIIYIHYIYIHYIYTLYIYIIYIHYIYAIHHYIVIPCCQSIKTRPGRRTPSPCRRSSWGSSMGPWGPWQYRQPWGPWKILYKWAIYTMANCEITRG